jgi:hypothetical protein
MQRGTQRFLAGGFVALALLMLLAVQGTNANSFSVTALGAEVHTGQAIDFVGTGFIPGEPVAYWLTLPDQTVIADPTRRFTAGQNGSVLLPYKVPAGTPGGTWHITLYGELSRSPVVTSFQVIDGTNLVPIIAAFPPAAPAGSYFGFYALGLKGDESVSYWISAPGGGLFEAFPDGAHTDGAGRVDIGWIAPYGVPPGTWVLTVQGNESNQARAIPFQIQ